MDKVIREQLVFIEFLKRNHLYQILESANVMQKMHNVWKETTREVVYLDKEQLSKLKWKYATIGVVIGMISVKVLNAFFGF